MLHRRVLPAGCLWAEWDAFIDSPAQKRTVYRSLVLGEEKNSAGERVDREGTTHTLRAAWDAHNVYVQHSVSLKDGDPDFAQNPLKRFAQYKADPTLDAWFVQVLSKLQQSDTCQQQATPAFINGHGSRVTKTHWDNYENILLVLHGSKTFYLASPDSTTVLHRDKGYDWEAPESTPATRQFDYVVTLQAGDVLFIPRYWWHYVETANRGAMVNFWFQQVERRRKRAARSRTTAQ